MTDYVFEVMKQFPGSFINCNNELILIPRTNLYFRLEDVNTPTELKYKLLEWCSRDCSCALRYSQNWRNTRYHDDVLARVNKCLETNFTHDEMELIYDVLGNRCNHELTQRFVSNGYDMKLLEKKRK